MPRENRLELDAETMRRLGYRVVDLLVDRIRNIDSEPAWMPGDRAALERSLREPPPDGPEDFENLLLRLTSDVLPFGARVDHPRFMGFVPGSPTWPGILGDFIAGGFNVFQGSWLAGSGASEIELIVLDWFRDWIGLPDTASGLFTSGGSAANLTAIACARQLRIGAHAADATIYLSSESHSSVERAARILGYHPDRVRKVPADRHQRMDPDALASMLDLDARAGLRPLIVVANAGATSTGAVDPLSALAAVAADRALWLHVDAAYGGFAVLTERGRAALTGIELADSITLDPHKWLHQPFEAGCLLVRDGRHLETAFRVQPEYLQDAALPDLSERERPVNFMDRGIQLTRSARAIKVWLSLKYFGVEPFREAIDRAIELAARAEARIRESAHFEIVSSASLGILCFRRITDHVGEPLEGEVATERLNARLVQALGSSGEAMLSSTRVNGRYALRICILNHRTSWSDVERVIEWLERAPGGALDAADTDMLGREREDGSDPAVGHGASKPLHLRA